MNYDRKALKLESKALLRATRPKVWMVTLVFVLLAAALPQLIKLACNPMGELIPQLLEDMADMLGYGHEPDERWVFYMVSQILGKSMVMLFLSVLFSLFAMVLSYGYKCYALRVFVRQHAGVGSIFTGFPLAGKVIGTEIMVGIFTFLWTLPIQLGGSLLLTLGETLFTQTLGLSVLSGLFSFLVTVAMWVLSLLVSIRYCLAPYFVMSDPDKGVFEAITASRQTMSGHYGKKLVLDLSFLGWGALVMLIIYVVCILGTALVLLTAGGTGLLELEELSHYAMSDWEMAYYVLYTLADLVRDIMAPMAVVLGVAWLAALPLNLWLTGYETVAEAGFFLTVTGRVLVVTDQEPTPAEPEPPIPTDLVPPIPTDLVPPVPTDPVDPEPTAPVDPEPPTVPVEPEPSVEADAPMAPSSNDPEPPAEELPVE